MMTGGNASSLMGASSGDKAEGPSRHYFYLREHLQQISLHITNGILFGLPIVVALFSLKYALVITAVEALSYFIGMMTGEFDRWYNSSWDGNQILMPETKVPTTEFGIIMNRLRYFETKYWISIRDMYFFLDEERFPWENNLDWIEIVSLLNQLSLYIGKRFEEAAETQKGKE